MKHFSEITASAERVVDAAESLVQLHGYNGFSYDDVARLVGIAKPSVHHHFPTKAELVMVVAQRYAHRFGERLIAIDARHTHAAKRLLAYADLFDETYRKDRRLCLCGMLGAEAEGLPGDVRNEVSRFFRLQAEWLTRVIREGQLAKTIRSDERADSLATSFLCALEGAMVVGRGIASEAALGKIAKCLVALLSA
jgi:TetR/AcrR family transcriptional repressor of nem operon